MAVPHSLRQRLSASASCLAFMSLATHIMHVTSACVGPVLRVGVMSEVAGVLAGQGKAVRDAVTLFEELYVNATRSGSTAAAANAPCLQVVHFKEDGTPANVSAAARAVLAANISLVILPLSAPLCVAAARVFADAGWPLLALAIGCSVGNTSVYDPYPNAFTLAPPNAAFMDAPLLALHAAGASRIVRLYQTDTSEFTAIEACTKDVTGMGYIDVTPPIGFSKNDAGYPGSVVAVIPNRVDVVLLCAAFPRVVDITLSARTQDVNAGAWVSFHTLEPARIATTTAALQGTYSIDSALWQPAPLRYVQVNVNDSTCGVWGVVGCLDAGTFASVFQTWSGSTLPPFLISASAFAAMEIFTQAVIAAKGHSRAVGVSTGALRTLIEGATFQTAYGTVRFGAASHANMALTGARQAQRGGVVILAPPSIATGALEYPAPTWRQQACLAAQRCGAGACSEDGNCVCDVNFVWIPIAAPTHCVHMTAFIVPFCTLATLFVTYLTRSAYYVHVVAPRRLAHAKALHVAQMDASRTAHQKLMQETAESLQEPLTGALQTLDELPPSFERADAAASASGSDVAAQGTHALHGAHSQGGFTTVERASAAACSDQEDGSLFGAAYAALAPLKAHLVALKDGVERLRTVVT